MLVSATDACVECKGADEALHEELAREAEDDGVEGDKGNVVRALAVHGGAIFIRGRVERVSVPRRQGVGEEKRFVNGIGFGRVDGVGREDNQDEDERIDPGVFEGDLFPFAQERACFPPFRVWT